MKPAPLSSNAAELLMFLYYRHMGSARHAWSARHAFELDHIDDLRACWKELRREKLVDDDATSWNISDLGLEVCSIAYTIET